MVSIYNSLITVEVNIYFCATTPVFFTDNILPIVRQWMHVGANSLSKSGSVLIGYYPCWPKQLIYTHACNLNALLTLALRFEKEAHSSFEVRHLAWCKLEAFKASNILNMENICLRIQPVSRKEKCDRKRIKGQNDTSEIIA